jgi:hypothetical protein
VSKPPLTKICANCGEPFQQRCTAASGLEAVKVFNKRRFCNRKCAAIKTAEERAR